VELTTADLEHVQPADVVLGVASPGGVHWPVLIDTVRAAVSSFAQAPRVIVAAPAETTGDGLTEALATLDAAVQLLPCAVPHVPRVPLAPDDFRGLFLMLREIAHKAEARGALVVGSDAPGVTPDLIRLLIQPLIEKGCDLVVPCYQRHPLEGLINSGIVYPLTRALYGRRIYGQIGQDFAFSTRLIGEYAATSSGSARPFWLAPFATCSGMRVCQANLDVRLPPAETQELSATLAAVLGSLFLDAERGAVCWQKVRGSHVVEAVGRSAAANDSPADADVQSMIESFRLGFRNLQDVWGLVLPPATLVELTQLARTPPERFVMRHEVWARIVFDFALGHRLRPISRDHLLRAMTPLYLAWAASFARQVAAAGPRGFDDLLDEMCVAFEVEKPYFVSRWRWPDRFHP
jgi:hypothetical protein